MPVVRKIDIGTEVHKYCIDKGFSKEGVLSHTLLTKGKFFVPKSGMQGFYLAMHKDLSLGCLPALQEVHTFHFPLFFDYDFKVPVDTLDDEFMVKVAEIMSQQVARFFPPSAPSVVCVVCCKSCGGVRHTAELYKHGLHVHFPKIIVTHERAKQIRIGVLLALDSKDWTTHLMLARPPWESILDEGVYKASENGGGLRMAFAPKAEPCKECPKGDSQKGCQGCGNVNKNHKIDWSHYVLFKAFVGGAVDAELTQRLGGHPMQLWQHTTVRCDDATPLTPGYEVFAACPLQSSVPAAAKGSKKRSSRGGVLDDDASRLPPKFRKYDEVTDPKIVEIMKRHVCRFSDKYETCRITVRWNGAQYRVLLSGEQARWCKNKKGYHNGQRVYMEVYKSKSAVTSVATMKCWCECKTVRDSGMMCKDYWDMPTQLMPEEHARCFSVTTTGNGSLQACASQPASSMKTQAVLDSIAATLTTKKR